MTKHLRSAVRRISLILLALTLAACGSAERGVNRTLDPGATLNTANMISTETLDPHMIQNELVYLLSAPYLAYDQLFVLGPDGAPQGRLVEKWSVSEDGLRVTMKLREDASFRDGSSLDAAVVVANLERARTLPSPLIKSQMAAVVGSEVTAPYEVVVTLGGPTPVLPYLLAGGAGYIMNPVLFREGDPATQTDGSGAYRVESFTPRERVSYVRDRDDYWDREAGKFARLVHRAIPDATALANAFAARQADIGQMQPNEVSSLTRRSDITLHRVGAAYAMDLYLNFTEGPLIDQKVRQAVNHAYDRRAVVDVMFPGSEPRWQQARAGLSGFDPALEEIYPYDVERARALLTEAGYPGGVELGEVLVSSSAPQGLEDLLTQQLAAAGIKITTRRVDALQAYQFWNQGRNAGMIAYASYGMEYSLGASYRWKLRQPGTMPAEFTTLLTAAADSRLPDAERDKGYRKVSDYLARQALSAPLVWVSYPWPTSDRVIGFDPATTNYNRNVGPHDFRHVAVAAR
ncbi:hypothetical protein IU483_25350 [Streptomyces gardneri]|nr:hypothetical protein [Streptomyces gardneri]